MSPNGLVVIGTSLGGLNALRSLLSALPNAFPAPLVIAQHRAPETDGLLRRTLEAASALPVLEPEDKTPLEAGHVYLAPAGYHLLVDGNDLALSVAQPVHHARPSIDVLFESAAESRGPGVVALILTGSGCDGVHGAMEVKRHGGILITEEPTTAGCGTLPAAVAAAVEPDHTLPLEQIPHCLARLFEPLRR